VGHDGLVTDINLEELFVLAKESALAAGDLLLEGWRGELEVDTKSTDTDVVTHMDRAAEALLLDRLLGARPADGILGEEGAAIDGTSGVRWIVDPLDGTVNYLYGLPHWAVSVAAQIDGESVVGVVCAPALGETYVAIRGGGAKLIDARGEHDLRCNDTADLAQALVGTGFGYSSSRRRAQASVVAAALPLVRDIRRFGACAIDMSWGAAGRLDAYYERGPHPWDHAAGSLIVREAGGVVGGLHGCAESEELVIAATAGVFGALHDLLAENNAALG
jgi:myo-inositol-1(or 4)-monophosphatase